jgi:hypothetical protein
LAEAETLADDVWIGVKALPPEVIADQNRVRPAETQFIVREIAAECRRHAPDFQKAGSCERLLHFLRKIAGEFGVVLCVVPGEGPKCGVHPVPVAEPHRRYDRVCVARAALIELHELVAVGKWKRLEENRIDCREDSGVSSDA